MGHNKVAEELGRLYATWAKKIKVVTDRTKPDAVRLAALHWIDRTIGEDLTPADDLETVAQQLIDEDALNAVKSKAHTK